MVAAIEAKQEKIALYSLVFLDRRCKLYGYLTNTVTCTTDWSEKTWRTNVIQVDMSYCVNAHTVYSMFSLCDSTYRVLQYLRCVMCIHKWLENVREQLKWMNVWKHWWVEIILYESDICCYARYESESQAFCLHLRTVRCGLWCVRRKLHFSLASLPNSWFLFTHFGHTAPYLRRF